MYVWSLKRIVKRCVKRIADCVQLTIAVTQISEVNAFDMSNYLPFSSALFVVCVNVSVCFIQIAHDIDEFKLVSTDQTTWFHVTDEMWQDFMRLWQISAEASFINMD